MSDALEPPIWRERRGHLPMTNEPCGLAPFADMVHALDVIGASSHDTRRTQPGTARRADRH
jgi:hypothetical protein